MIAERESLGGVRAALAVVGVRPGLSSGKPSVWAIASAFVICAIVLYVGYRNLHYATDDSHITYRYAYNLATGNGFVYNPGERFLGTSAPLFGMAIGVLGIPMPSAIPQIAILISIASLLAAALGAIALGRSNQNEPAGIAIALLIAAHPFFASTIGSEMLTQLALIVWGFVQYQRGRTTLAAALFAVATLVRPDALVASLIVLGHLAATKRRESIRSIATYLAILIPFVIASKTYYGSVLPSTMEAKAAQTSQGWPSIWAPMFHQEVARPGMYLPSQALDSLSCALFWVTVAIGLVVLARRGGGWWLPILWASMLFLVDGLVKLPFYQWYYTPFEFAFCILAGLGASLLWTSRRKAIRIAGAASVLVMPIVELPQVSTFTSTPVHADYQDLSRWLQENTPRGASLAYCEIGILGYYSHRRIIDPLGLVTPGAAKLVSQGRIADVVRLAMPDYIIGVPRFGHLYMDAVQSSSWFRQNYRVCVVLPGRFEPMTVYRRLGPDARFQAVRTSAQVNGHSLTTGDSLTASPIE